MRQKYKYSGVRVQHRFASGRTDSVTLNQPSPAGKYAGQLSSVEAGNWCNQGNCKCFEGLECPSQEIKQVTSVQQGKLWLDSGKSFLLGNSSFALWQLPLSTSKTAFLLRAFYSHFGICNISRVLSAQCFSSFKYHCLSLSLRESPSTSLL